MPNIVSDHFKEQVFSDINLLLRDMMKLIKVLTIYPSDNPLPNKMRGSFGKRFTELVNMFNGLSFVIGPSELRYSNEIVFRDRGKEESLAALFYNSGITLLEFRAGLVLEEIDRFLEAIKTFLNDRSLDSDLVSNLWQEQCESIEFKTVEDLALGECDTEIVIQEMRSNNEFGRDQSEIDYNNIILEENRQALQEPAEQAGGSLDESMSPEMDEDLRQMGLMPDHSTEADDQIDMLFSSSYTPAEEDEKELKRLIEKNRFFDPYRTVTRILNEILQSWEEPKPFMETVTICEKILYQLLDHGEFAVAADFVHTIRGLQEHIPKSRAAFIERIEGFLRSAGDSRRIHQLTDIINQQEKVDTGSIEMYLESLGWESLQDITGMLGRLVAKNARLMVCDYLAKHGRKNITIIGNGVYDKQWYVVRNTVMILGHLADDKALDYLAMTITHSDIRVRKEAMRALVRFRSEKAGELLCRFLDDPDIRIRNNCLRHLSRAGGRKPFEAIKEIIHSSKFEHMPAEEQEKFLIAYSRLGGEEVVDQLGAMAGSFCLFISQNQLQRRMNALTALIYNRSDEAELMILTLTRSYRRWLREAAAAALDRRRRIAKKGGENGEH